MAAEDDDRPAPDTDSPDASANPAEDLDAPEASNDDEDEDERSGANDFSEDPVTVDDGPREEDSADEAAAAPEGPPRSHRYWLVAAVTIVLLAVDLWTKQWAWDNLREGAVETVIEGRFYLEFGFNTGSAFSLLRDASWSRMLFIGITVLALLYMGHMARNLPTRFGSAFVAIGMVSSGALGNLHDRFVRTMVIDGVERYGVVDFIKVLYWEGKPWPTFNVADIALVVGVILLLYFLIRHGDVLDPPAKEDTSS
ncbi:MAG: signal peptidase II [Myxococcota bacterium]